MRGAVGGALVAASRTTRKRRELEEGESIDQPAMLPLLTELSAFAERVTHLRIVAHASMAERHLLQEWADRKRQRRPGRRRPISCPVFRERE